MLTLLPVAFLSGILTVFSPCVLPILPIILSSGLDGNKSRVRGVIIGLILSFSVAALFLSAIVTLLGFSADSLRTLAAFLLFIIGISILFPIWEKLQFYIERLFSKFPTTTRPGFFGGFLTGVGLGLVWTPCVGPIVAAISTLAAVNKISLASVALVLAYAIGVGVPLWLIATQGSRFTSKLNFVKQNPVLVRQIFGIILMLTSIFVYFGYEKRLQVWFLDNLPEKWVTVATLVETKFGAQDVLRSPKESTLDLTKIENLCSREECFPPIDYPQFVSADESFAWLSDEDVVFGVNYLGIQRAYPRKILRWHKVVNDMYSETPVVVNFCAFCETAVSYIGLVAGTATKFGFSGDVYEGDAIIYDRSEVESLWLQSTGEAIAGPAYENKAVLNVIPTTTTTWGRWKEKHPNTTVLSRDTGYNYAYDSESTPSF